MTENEAKLNITWRGNNGDLRDPIFFNATDGDIKAWATEAVSSGSVPGIPADPDVDFADFMVDRFRPTEQRPENLVMLRSKTPFGR
jgi:hypothetical protein